MSKLNPCVTGDTKVWTVDGFKSFDELNQNNEDVMVYCIDDTGELKISKMMHPRITGYNMTIFKVTLENGIELKVTQNHEFLTIDGYKSVEDLYDGDEIIIFDEKSNIPTEVDYKLKPYIEYTGTKKGTIIKNCECSNDIFEVDWDEREICVAPGNENKFYNQYLTTLKSCIYTFTKDGESSPVKKIEVLDEKENVYNGTVAVYHNYFTFDENTNTLVNQLNCGE